MHFWKKLKQNKSEYLTLIDHVDKNMTPAEI